jgi:hypothetical protein
MQLEHQGRPACVVVKPLGSRLIRAVNVYSGGENAGGYSNPSGMSEPAPAIGGAPTG